MAGLNAFGLQVQPVLLDVILPIGISFYTFQSMSYVIDVYRRDMAARKRSRVRRVRLVLSPPGRRADHARQYPGSGRAGAEEDSLASSLQAGVLPDLLGATKKVVVADNLASSRRTPLQRVQRSTAWICCSGPWRSPSRSIATSPATPTPPAASPSAWASSCMLNFQPAVLRHQPQGLLAALAHVASRPGCATTSTSPWAATGAAAWRIYRNLMLTMVLGGLWHGRRGLLVWGLPRNPAGQLSPGGSSGGRSDCRPRAPWYFARMVLMFGFTVTRLGLLPGAILGSDRALLHRGGFQTSAETPRFFRRLLFFAVPLMALEAIQERASERGLDPPTALAAPLGLHLPAHCLDGGCRRSGTVDFIYFQF